MASHARISRPGQPFSYESPEQKARDVLRGQKTIASTTQRANQQAQSIAALTELAKGVPANELPPGGIHKQMSPADVQAATDRINAYRARTGQQAQGAQGPAGPAVTTPSGGTISGRVTQDAQGNRVPVPGDTRRTPTGGTETLVQSQSGPRWVASVNNAPAPNNMNGQVSRDPGGRTVQVQPVPVGAPVTGPGGNRGTDAANFQANLRLAQNPTQPIAAPKPAPFQYTTPAEATQIAKRFGDPTGGMVTNGPASSAPIVSKGPLPPPAPMQGPAWNPSEAEHVTPGTVASNNAPMPTPNREYQPPVGPSSNRDYQPPAPAAPAPKPTYSGPLINQPPGTQLTIPDYTSGFTKPIANAASAVAGAVKAVGAQPPAAGPTGYASMTPKQIQSAEAARRTAPAAPGAVPNASTAPIASPTGPDVNKAFTQPIDAGSEEERQRRARMASAGTASQPYQFA